MNAEELQRAIDSLATARGRSLWETMQAISAAAPEHREIVRASLPVLVAAAGRDSVIARDHVVRVLTMLMASDNSVREPYLDILKAAPDNQFPMYAELGAAAIGADSDEFEGILIDRLDRLAEPKRRRVNAVLKALIR